MPALTPSAGEKQFEGNLIVSFDYYGNRYRGRLLRITGKGAEVKFTVGTTRHPKFGRERVRRVDPIAHKVTILCIDELDKVVRTLTAFHSMEEMLNSAETGYTPSLLGGFLYEVLGNCYDQGQHRRKCEARSFTLRRGERMWV